MSAPTRVTCGCGSTLPLIPADADRDGQPSRWNNGDWKCQKCGRVDGSAGHSAEADRYVERHPIAAFAVGQRVLKHSGDYRLEGEVRAVFTTKAGMIRYVVEHYPGFLHIYNESNLRALP